MRTGSLTVQLVGSTGAITTIEYEPGALEDLQRALEVIAPRDADYSHNARWGDDNRTRSRDVVAVVVGTG